MDSGLHHDLCDASFAPSVFLGKVRSELTLLGFVHSFQVTFNELQGLRVEPFKGLADLFDEIVDLIGRLG